MKLLHQAGLRHLLRHPAQLGLALAGLTLGVATVVAVDIAASSARRAFGLSLTAVTGSATHQLEGGPRGIDERLYFELRRDADGQTVLAPEVTGHLKVADRLMRLVGIDPLASRDLAAAGPGLLTASADTARRWFTQEGAVLMSAGAAHSLGLAVNSRFDLEIDGVPRRATLIGLLGSDAAGADDLVLTDIAQAQEWLGLGPRLTGIELRVPQGPAGEAALSALRRRLPPDVTLSSLRATAAETFAMTDAFTTNLRAMSLLALLVGALLIYSAVSFAILQRRAIVAVLRALGATRAEVLASLFAQAALLGVIGALCGVVCGVLLSRTLVRLVSRTINDLYFVVAVNQTALPVHTLVLAGAAGIAVALLATGLPALEVARDAPRLGLARSVLERRALGIARALVPLSLACAAAAAGTVVLSGRSLLGGFVALFLLLAAVAGLTPAGLYTLAQLAGRSVAGASPLARLALRDVAGSLSRTGVAAAALAMALTAMIGVAIMVGSFRESLRDWLRQTLRADVYVSAPGSAASLERRLEPSVVAALLAVPGVRAHSEGRRVRVASSAGPVEMNALALLPESRPGFRLTQGSVGMAWAGFERGDVLVSEPLAWRLQLRLQDSLQLVTASGPRAFTVAGIYREYGNDRGEVLMDLARYRRLWNDGALSALGIYAGPGVDVNRLVARLRAASRGRQALLIRSNAALREMSMSIFDRTFIITRVLYWLAAVAAALGLVSALLAWQLQRARELALLRTLGLTPWGSAAVVLAQTLFMGVAALLAALPAGLVTALVLTDVINRRAFGWQIELHFTVRQFSDALWLALAAAAAAGLYPAWRSAAAPLAAGLREE